MDGNYTPCALDAELFEKGGGDDALVGNESVWVQQRAAHHADADDTETSSKGLREVTDDGSTRHCTEVGNNLCYSDGVGIELELVRQHCRVETFNTLAQPYAKTRNGESRLTLDYRGS